MKDFLCFSVFLQERGEVKTHTHTHTYPDIYCANGAQHVPHTAHTNKSSAAELLVHQLAAAVISYFW